MLGPCHFNARTLAVLILAWGAPVLDGASARWRCEPAEVELGQPFELVLELEHSASAPGGELAAGELVLDESWLVLGEEPVQTERADEGRLVTRRAWRVASLEPGARSLGEALSRFALPEGVTRIQVGAAEVRVRGVLAEGEDAPRALREFPEDFAGSAEDVEVGSALPWLFGAGVPLAAGAGWLAWRRRRRARAEAAPATTLERLGELEREFAGERARAGCFELTRLLRGALDDARAHDRSGLTDEEWLAELTASRAQPGVTEELTQVFARAARVKYAGEPATPWALQETFAHARRALAALDGGRTPA